MIAIDESAAPQLDRSVPALVVKVGHYPWHHGGVGAIRSLGRLGVPVYAITEDRWTPAALSRYLRGRFVWPTTGLEEPAQLVIQLVDIGRRIGKPTVLVPFDDEAAVLIAEHQADLKETFLFAPVDPDLPRRLASKRGLHDLCHEYGVPTPKAAFPGNRTELESFAAQAGFPLMAKNLEAFERKRAPVVNSSTRLDDLQQLRAMGDCWGEEFSIILQEYLPSQDSEDWFVHAYCDESSHCLVQFTGRKLRSFPLEAGMTSRALAVGNPDLMEMTERFLKSIGYRGALDLDVRYDRRTGEYNLLDFNPRVGAQFRLFENACGIDMVRAMHLALTGRPVPAAPQVDGRQFVVENFELLAALRLRRRYALSSAITAHGTTEFAWAAADDPRPAVSLLVRTALRKLW